MSTPPRDGRDVDVAILGGGPAGCAAAIAAARAGLAVALFEPQRPPIDKPCGEGILPAGVRALAELGVDVPAHLARELRAIRYVLGGEERVRVQFGAPGLAVMRPVLMELLESALARASGVERHAVRAHAMREGAAFVVRAGERVLARARTLVAADGLGGDGAPWLRARPGAHDAHRGARAERLGVRARFTPVSTLDDVEVHFGRDCEVYLTPLAGGGINVAVLYEHVPERARALGARGLLEHALAAHPRVRARLGAPLGAAEARALAHPLPWRTCDGESFLAGDAGGGIDPILGCGVSLALRSGVVAARCALACLAGAPPDDVARAYERFHAREVRGRRRLASLLRRAASAPRAARAIAWTARASPLVRRALVRVAEGSLELPPLPGALAQPRATAESSQRASGADGSVKGVAR